MPLIPKIANNYEQWLMALKEYIDDTDKPLSDSMTESDLDELLAKGEGMILIGTGTAGQRVFINANRGELHMSDDKYGQGYRNRFRSLFNLPMDGEARVSF